MVNAWCSHVCMAKLEGITGTHGMWIDVMVEIMYDIRMPRIECVRRGIGVSRSK